jgi:hypothetical protein
MEVFLSAPHTPEELRKLIAWHQYYDVILVSDVASSSDDTLLLSVWKGDPLPRCRVNPSSPRRPPRHSLDLALWQRALQPLIRTTGNRKLLKLLGPWVTPPPDTWLFQYSPQTDHLYHRFGDLWLHYRRTGNRVNRRLNHGTFSRILGWCPDLPLDLCRADIRRNRVSLTLLSIGHHSPSPIKSRPTELAAAVLQLAPHHSWATATLLQSDNGVAVADAIRTGHGLAVSDSSFKDSRSTSAFLFEGPNGAAGRIFGTNRVPGQRMDQGYARANGNNRPREKHS